MCGTECQKTFKLLNGFGRETYWSWSGSGFLDPASKISRDSFFRICNPLLSPSEKENFLQNSHPLQTFARYFVAKEAYFKAAGGVWMGGASGFAEIEVDCDEEKFYVRGKGVETHGNFFDTPDGLGASVLVWKKRENP